MSGWSALAGHFLGLPPRRCRVERSMEWVAMSDGTRLATTLYRPDREVPRSSVLARTIASAHDPRPAPALLPRLLAEQGHRVVVQECRGLQTSEGRFDPFRHDGDDGADTLDWLEAQPGSGGPLALLGFGYAGHAAWATLAAARRPVQGLLVGFAARDPHAWLYTGGALELENGFGLALALAAAEREGAPRPDLARAVRFRPLLEADRVASRRIDWLREWLEHPDRDDYWQARTPPIPARPPSALLMGAWYHPALAATLADHAALADAASTCNAPAPRLVVGPWTSVAAPRRQRPKGTWLTREIARSAVGHLDSICGDSARPAPPVRIFTCGGGWRESAEWPPRAEERRLYLRADARSAGGGRLSSEAPTGSEPPDRYLYDPADPVPSEAGAAHARPGAAVLAAAEARGDVLRYATQPETTPLELLGTARVELFASSDAAQTDFVARLARVDEAGFAHHLTDGIARVRPGGEKPARITIELAPLCHRLRPGERLRLDLTSSCFPRFDLHPNTDASTARVVADDCRTALQRIHHDADHPSCVRLWVR